MLKRINDENKKTKEVLEKIDRGEFKKDKREMLPYLGKRKDEGEEEEGEESTNSTENG